MSILQTQGGRRLFSKMNLVKDQVNEDLKLLLLWQNALSIQLIYTQEFNLDIYSLLSFLLHQAICFGYY